MPNQPSADKQLVPARLPKDLVAAVDKSFTEAVRNRTERIIAALRGDPDVKKHLNISKPSK